MNNNFQFFLQKTGVNLFFLLAFSIFISKPAINIFSSLLLLAAFIYIFFFDAKEFLLKNRYVLILLFPVVIGLLLSFFSMAGAVEGPVEFLKRYRFLLLVVPFAMFIKKNKEFEKIYIILNISALIFIFYGLINSDITDLFRGFNSFHKWGRASDMIFSLFLLNIIILLNVVKKKFHMAITVKIFILLTTILLMIGVVALGERGAWVGLFCGLFLFFFFFEKKFFFLLILMTVLSSFYLPSSLYDRGKSIFDVTQRSNMERLNLYKVGFDYLIYGDALLAGTGSKNTESQITDFIKTKPQAYQEKYLPYIVKYSGNLHNCFLQMAVENGIIFLLLYFISIFFILFKMIKSLFSGTNYEQTIIIATIMLTIGFLVSQIFHEELYRYGGLVFYLVFCTGCFVQNQKSKVMIFE